MKRLLFVRHGQTDFNESNRLSGRIDSVLTDKGREQATEAGQKIKSYQDIKIDIIVSSPLIRAKETAGIIANIIGYPKEKILVNQLFTERNFGINEGIDDLEFLKTHSYKDYDYGDGAETIAVLQQRADAALEWLEQLPYDTVLLVGHAAFGRALRRVLKGEPPEYEFVGKQPMANGEIATLI